MGALAFQYIHDGLSGEYGRERIETDDFTEPLSAQNPFEAHVAAGTDCIDLAKLRLQWSHNLTPRLDGTLSVAAVRGLNRTSELLAFVPGIGTMAPARHADLDRVWGAHRLQADQRNDAAAFANGVSGKDAIDTRFHGGAALRVQF